MEPDFAIVLPDGKKIDAPLHEDMLANEHANFLADLAAFDAALEIGFTREEAAAMCGLKEVPLDLDEAIREDFG